MCVSSKGQYCTCFVLKMEQGFGMVPWMCQVKCLSKSLIWKHSWNGALKLNIAANCLHFRMSSSSVLTAWQAINNELICFFYFQQPYHLCFFTEDNCKPCKVLSNLVLCNDVVMLMELFWVSQLLFPKLLSDHRLIFCLLVVLLQRSSTFQGKDEWEHIKFFPLLKPGRCQVQVKCLTASHCGLSALLSGTSENRKHIFDLL